MMRRLLYHIDNTHYVKRIPTPTPIPISTPEVEATPTPIPGFEAIFVIASLLAVAYLLVKRR
jgi:PGF-CTERM protein